MPLSAQSSTESFDSPLRFEPTDAQRDLRDARLLTIAGGPNELHRNALADAVLGA